ncbi:tripartite tricarboxylate transporter TctB family protein [Roseovarius atlanticus]|uniref:tripartite tricarboxylate transporter TctB family protein n=1 Tax=Roseovarius atlanticus TaxID=1641875 RepID=UPI000AF2D5AC|nr:tripartite tricarboxylate transporter TctB family protein [Roseovarius atlanticus]
MKTALHKGAETRRINVVAGILLAATSLACILWLFPGHVSSETTPGDLPPTVIPYLSAGVVFLLAVGLVLQTLFRDTGEELPVPSKSVLSDVLFASAATGVILLAFYKAGFLALAIPLTAVTMIFSGGRNRLVIALVSVLFPLMVWLGARFIFGVYLP